MSDPSAGASSPQKPRPNRRQALQVAAAGALASPLIGAASYGRIRGANETLGLAIMGTGGMGRAHGQAFMGIANRGEDKVELRGLADVCQVHLDSAMANAAKGQPDVKTTAYRDYREALASKDIDCVVVSSPEHWHAQMAIDGLQAGKDVYVEKPMTFDLRDAHRLANTHRELNQILAVGTQYVTDPKYLKAGELIKAGAIGKPVSSQTGYCRNSKNGEWTYYGINPKTVPGPMLDWDAWCGPRGPHPFDTKVFHRWRRYKEWSTGIIGDLLVHQVTPLMAALDQGWPTHVVAIGGHYVDKDMGNPDQVNILVQFEKGHTMTIYGSTCNATTPPPAIQGHMGNLLLGGNQVALRPESIYSDEIEPETFKMQKGSSHDALRRDWLAACRERREPLSPLELGLKVMVIVDLAHRSSLEGCAYGYNPETHEAKAL